MLSWGLFLAMVWISRIGEAVDEVLEFPARWGHYEEVLDV